METTHNFFLVQERSKQSEASILSEMMLLLDMEVVRQRGRVDMGQSGVKVKSCKCGTWAEAGTELSLRSPLSRAHLWRHRRMGSYERQRTLEMPRARRICEMKEKTLLRKTMREKTLLTQKDERDRKSHGGQERRKLRRGCSQHRGLGV